MTDKSYFYMLLLLFSQLLFSCGAEESLDASLGDSRAVRFSRCAEQPCRCVARGTGAYP